MDETLKQKLAQFRQSLEQVDQLDDESAQLLREIDADIQNVLKGDESAGLDHRLEQQAVAFEGEHPQLSAILRDVMDTLSKMGI
jgi:uncharacterized protein (UPF0335 family)